MKKAITAGLFLVAIILISTGILPSCKHETLNLAQMDTVCFERDVLPVFKNGCATPGCHNGNGESFALKSYPDIKRRVSAGSPATSRLYQAIISTMIQPMPPSHALAESDRIKIRIWIEQGAKDTKCSPLPEGNLNNEGGLN